MNVQYLVALLFNLKDAIETLMKEIQIIVTISR
jgi:hypothetical protein